MSIGVQGEACGEVAEHAGNGFYVNSILQRNRSEGVAEVVEADFGDACPCQDSFSLSKRKCGMGLITAKLQETAEHVIAMSILVLNLRRAVAALLCLFYWLMGLATRSGLQNEKMLLIQ